MRKHIFSIAVLLGTAIFASISCQVIPLENDVLVGQQVNFTAATSYLNGRGTRTEYSGVDENGNPVGTSSQYERIDWVVNDQFRIYSPKSQHANTGVHYADYFVRSLTKEGKTSNAKIAPVGGNGLVWMDSGSDHSFYCVYPDPATNENVSIGKDGSDIKIGGKVLPTQAVDWDGNDAKPAMNYAYMFASVLNAGPTSDVKLYFKPMVTAFKVTVSSADEDELTLIKFRMESTSCALSGDFTAKVTGATTDANYSLDAASFTCPAYVGTGDSANNFIEVDLGNHKIYKTPGEQNDRPTSASFTVFALPQDITDVTLYLYTSASTEPRKIALKQAGTSVTFDACQKAFINNLAIPGVWNYEMTGAEAIVVPAADYADNSVINRSLRADKYATNLTPKDVAWKAYFVPADETPLIGSLKLATWSDTPLQDEDGNDWLTLSKYQGTGALEDVSFTVAANTLPPRYVDGGVAGLAMITTLQGKSHSNLDLSTYNFMDGTTGANSEAETANCYVIDGYGTYLIPLVYGNAVQKGSPTTRAYTRTTAVTYSASNHDSPQLTTLLNADYQPIGSSYILSDGNLQKSGSYEGIVIWQDVLEGFEIVEESDDPAINDITFETAPSGAALPCAYLKVRIKQENVKPGNVIIALKDKGLDKVLWSWHLWITAEPLSIVEIENDRSDKVSLLSSNIGSTPPLRYSGQETTPRDQNVVFVAQENNMVLQVMPVSQEQYIVEPDHRNERYASTYYQWGRKDPFLPSAGQVSSGTNNDLIDQPRRNRVKTVTSKYFPIWQDGMNNAQTLHRDHIYSTEDPGVVFPSDLKVLVNQNTESKYNRIISQSIQHPELYFVENQLGYGVQYQNMWDVNYSYNRYSLCGTKSVYDPCPRGFAVPRYHAFTAWTNAGSDFHATRTDADPVFNSETGANLPGERNRGIWVPLQFKGYGTPEDGLFLPAEAYKAHSHSNAWYASEVISLYTADRAGDDEKVWTGGSGSGQQHITAKIMTFYYFSSSSFSFGTCQRLIANPIRPVLDVPTTAGLGATTTGQTVINKDFSGNGWE